MPKKIELLTGQTIKTTNNEDTNLIYVKDVNSLRLSDRRVLIKCFCGNIFETFLGHIRNKSTKSCGCIKKEMYASGRAGYKHGLTFRPDYARLSHLRREYGMTLDDYEKLHKNQKGCCAICGIDEKKLKGRWKQHTKLHVDHNHETGEIRGLLCNGCNRGLGYFNDDIRKLQNAVKYLTKTEDLSES